MIKSLLVLLLLLQKPGYVPPGGVEGTLTTIEGKPAIAVRVVAYRVPGSGNPDDNLNYFELDRPVSYTQTDNEGHYMMQDLPPSTYYIMAGTAGQGTYFPGTSDLRLAAKIAVKSNEMVERLDIKLLNRYGGKVIGRVNADMAVLGPRKATITGPPLEDLVEVDVGPDGNFQMPQLPNGNYLLSMWPPTSGMPSVKIKVTDKDITGEVLTPLPTQTVTGRIVVSKGPLPIPILLFETDRFQTGATINADGTFVAQLHADTHRVTVNGLPVGYSLMSVRVGDKDASQGIVVGKADISDVIISLNAPEKLAAVHGKITGLATSRYANTRVQMTGLIVGAMQASVRPDGTFDFPAVMPGSYTLKLNGVPEFSSMIVNADGPSTFDITVAVPNR